MPVTPSTSPGPGMLSPGLPIMDPAASPSTAPGIEYDGHGETPGTFGPHDTIRLRFGRSSDAFTPAEYEAYLKSGGDIEAAYAAREAATPWVPPSDSATSSGPPGYSYITGTIDPTAAEIIAAAEMSGMHIPPGIDPIAFSKMMSGGPPALPTGPPPLSMSAPLATSVVTPAAPPLAAISLPSTTPIPTPAPAPVPTAPVATAAPLIPVKTVVPAELTTIAPKPTDTAPELFVEKLRAVRAKSFGGIGGYSRCDPITGKCSNYA